MVVHVCTRSKHLYCYLEVHLITTDEASRVTRAPGLSRVVYDCVSSFLKRQRGRDVDVSTEPRTKSFTIVTTIR